MRGRISPQMAAPRPVPRAVRCVAAGMSQAIFDQMKITPQPLTPEAFAPFGEVLTPKDPGFNPLVVEADAPGWQAALNHVTATAATKIHRHFNTKECFAPLRGEAVFLVAPPDNPTDIHAFHLTGPACVHPHVWHCTIAPRGDALIFICENAEVTGEEIDLADVVGVVDVDQHSGDE